MRKLWAVLACLALLACFASCTGHRYTEKEKEAAQKKGEEMMQAWLEKELPGAELLSAEPYIFHRLGIAPYELTDIVSGSVRQEGRELRCWMDTGSGEVWIEQSGETMDELGRLCGVLVAEALGFGEGYEITEARAEFEIGVLERPPVLPAAFVLSGGSLEEFLRAPGERPALSVSLSYLLPEEASLSRFTLADMRRVLEENGLTGSVYAENTFEEVSLSADKADYKRWGFLDLPDFRLFAALFERRETVDPETGETVTEITELDADRDLRVERTAEGWKTSFTNGYFTAFVYAYDGSELLEREYIWRETPGAVNGYDKPLEWKENALGWALCFRDSGVVCSLSEEHEIAEVK